MSDDIERRTEPRISTMLQAVILDDEQYAGRTFPVSGFGSTGAFLQRTGGDVPLPSLGSVIQIQFSWPRESKIAPISVQATVVRTEVAGIGVKFDITA